MDSFTIDLNGFNSFKEVEISCRFVGGKSFISPPDVPILEPNRAVPKSVKNGDNEPEEILDYRNYRDMLEVYYQCL